MASEVKVEITVEEKQALSAISKIINATGTMEKKTVKSAGKMDAAFSSFAGNLASVAATKAFSVLSNGIRDVVKASADLEVFETQFKTILGSATAAKEQLMELQDFAANTPFQLPGLALATRQLLSFGVEQEKIIPTLQQIGDLAAATGSSIDDLTIPYGRLISTQKLTLIELDKFNDRGINLYKKLSDQTGRSLKTIRDDISNGKVDFEEFTKALDDLTGEGGMFFGAMEAQSRTLTGVMSTLGDNVFNLEGAIGDAFKPALIAGAEEFSEIAKELTEVFVENGPAIAKVASSLVEIFITEPHRFWKDFFGGESVSKLSAVNTEITELEATVAKLENRMAAKKDDTLYNSFIGKHDDDMKQFSEAIFALSELKRARDALVEKKEEKKAEDGEDPRVKKELQVFDEIAEIRAQQALAEQENELLLKEAQLTANEEDLQALRDVETEKLNIKKEFALEKASFIADDLKRQKEVDKINAKFELDAEKLRGKQSVDRVKKAAAQEKIVFNARNQTLGNFIQAGLLLSAEGSAAHRVLATIDATRQTYVAANNALATKAPYPLPIAFAASTVALGLANVAKINKFETGGVVGGFNGASLGQDNTLASVRNGEMVLTGAQQKTLFQDISNGGEGGDNSALMASILAQPIIIEIDGREIARANRTAIEEGFAGAA